MTARPGYFQEAQVPDMERRLSDVVVIGIVEETDYSDDAAPRVRVKVGKESTGWVAWSSGSAGGNTDWEPLDVGEQVVMVSPSGDRSQAIILGSINQTKFAAPSKNPDESMRRWKDGSQQSYDREKHEWTLKLNTAGKFTVNIGGTELVMKDGEVGIKTKVVTVSASAGMTFDTPQLTVTGDVVAGGVSVINHLHKGVMPGNGVSGPPIGGSGGGGVFGVITDPFAGAGDPAAGTVGNGIAADASGVFKQAWKTRIPYLGSPNKQGVTDESPYPYAKFPQQPALLTEDDYYERVRLSADGVMAAEALSGEETTVNVALVSAYDRATSEWSDDIINVGSGIAGQWRGQISAGISGSASNGPFNVYRSEAGNYYAHVYPWTYQAQIWMEGFSWTISGTNYIFWKLTDEDVGNIEGIA